MHSTRSALLLINKEKYFKGMTHFISVLEITFLWLCLLDLFWFCFHIPKVKQTSPLCLLNKLRALLFQVILWSLGWVHRLHVQARKLDTWSQAEWASIGLQESHIVSSAEVIFSHFWSTALEYGEKKYYIKAIIWVVKSLLFWLLLQ